MSFFKTFSGQSLRLNARFLEQRIDIKKIKNLSATETNAYMIEPENGGLVYVYRYGAVIFFGMTQKEEQDFLTKEIIPYLNTPIEDLVVDEDEETIINVRPKEPNKVSFDHIDIKKPTEANFLVISDIFAKSVALSHYESKISEIFTLLDPVSNMLQAGGYPSRKQLKVYLKHIGVVLNMQRNMAGTIGVNEKPEILWNNPPELTNFYARLEDEYEIAERHAALKEKLDVIHHTAETMVDLLQTRQSLRVEWYITILIIFDILLHLAEKYLHI